MRGADDGAEALEAMSVKLKETDWLVACFVFVNLTRSIALPANGGI